jgi:hypothetical protein
MHRCVCVCESASVCVCVCVCRLLCSTLLQHVRPDEKSSTARPLPSLPLYHSYSKTRYTSWHFTNFSDAPPLMTPRKVQNTQTDCHSRHLGKYKTLRRTATHDIWKNTKHSDARNSHTHTYTLTPHLTITLHEIRDSHTHHTLFT